MNLAQFMNSGTRALGGTALRLQKVSPEILVGAGIVGLVAAGVVAARATVKAAPVIERAKEGLEVVELHSRTEEGYSEKHRKHDLVYIYKTTTLELVKTYAPAVTLGALGVACVLGGHHMLRQRNVALAAAYKLVETSYAEYRKRVRAEIGDDREREIYQDVREIEVVNHKGKTVKKKVPGPMAGNGYGRFFDQLNPNYVEDNQTNKDWILSVQRHYNTKLNLRGYVFLNEVYETLGFEKTTAGQVVGWCSWENDGEDCQIDFGIDDPANKQAQLFIRGDERAVFLDFNVDGEIHKKIFN